MFCFYSVVLWIQICRFVSSSNRNKLNSINQNSQPTQNVADICTYLFLQNTYVIERYIDITLYCITFARLGSFPLSATKQGLEDSGPQKQRKTWRQVVTYWPFQYINHPCIQLFIHLSIYPYRSIRERESTRHNTLSSI